MPDPPFNTIKESLKFVGAASFEGDPIYFGPNETRPLPGGVSPLRSSSDSDDSGKAVVVKSDTDSGVTGKELMNVASSSSSSTVAETQDMCNNLASGSSSQHDKAEDTADVPKQEPRLFEDTREQADIISGLGYYKIMQLMALLEEPQDDADPHQVQEPEDLLMLSPPIATFLVPSFSMGLAGGIVPFAEEQFVEDSDEVGLENLGILMNP